MPKHLNFTKGFSLVELLTSLITISVIVAGFAPVVTHKLKHGGVSITKGETITNKCDHFSPKCQLCTKNKCLICNLSCSENEYLDKDNCKCLPCPQNCHNCNETGCLVCKDGYQKEGSKCNACNPGFYSSAGELCKKCPKGQKANALTAASKCIDCNGDNEYQDLEAQTSCKICSGFITNNHKECITCPMGTFWNGSQCTDCEAGTYSDSTNATVCKQCLEGTYQNENGKSSCKPCQKGTFQDQRGKTSCKVCSGISTLTGCQSCSMGSYIVNDTCQKCPAGTISTALNALECTKCKAYQYSNRERTACLNCFEGYISSNACIPCSSFGNSCTSCTEKGCNGQSCPNCEVCTNKGCTACNKGYYNNSGVCEKCPINCSECAGHNQCTTCNEGYYNNSGVCEKCSAEECKICTDANTCTSCISGYYAANGECISCTIGYGSKCIKCNQTKCTRYYHKNPTSCEEGDTLSCIACPDNYLCEEGQMCTCNKYLEKK